MRLPVSGFVSVTPLNSLKATLTHLQLCIWRQTSQHFQPCLYFKPNHDVFLNLSNKAEIEKLNPNLHKVTPESA